MTEEEIIQTVKAAKRIHVLGAMTVNERLFMSGLFDEFYEARYRDKQKAYRILELLDVDRLSIESALE